MRTFARHVMLALPVVAVWYLCLLLLPPVLAIDSITDRTALESIYQGMGGAQWTRQTRWLASDVSMCAWFGVKCQTGCPTNSTSIECRVVELSLASNRLQGAISPGIEQLANLTKLVLGRNALAGTIPSFNASVNLQWLDLNTASLTGSIPDLRALRQLRRLELFGNRLGGTLPDFAHATQVRVG